MLHHTNLISLLLPLLLVLWSFLPLAITATPLHLQVPIPLTLSALDQLSTDTCSTGIHMIIARGSTESPGPGILALLAVQLADKIPNSSTAAVPYPATIRDYAASESEGVAAMTRLIKKYVERCPQGKVVLMGYSQGGQVTLDTLCGTSEKGFNSTEPLEEQYSENILAAITMGDPSHTPDQPYNVGTSARNGIFPRLKPTCHPYATAIQSYCDTGDPYCDSGDKRSVHTGYVFEYGGDAVDFVVGRWKDVTKDKGEEESRWFD